MIRKSRFVKKLSRVIILLIGCVFTMNADSQSKEDVKMMIQFMGEMFAEIKPSKGVVEEAAAEMGVPTELTIDEINQRIQFFKKSFYFKPSSFDKDQLELVCDPAHLYFSEHVAAKTKWSIAKIASGENILDVKSNDEIGKDMPVSRMVRENVLLTKPLGKDVISLSGSMVMRYPSKTTVFELPINDFESEKKIGNSIFRLINLENDLVVIWSSAQSHPFSVFPFSTDGIALDATSTTEGPYSVYIEISTKQKLSDQFIDKYAKSRDELDKDGRVTSIKAKGKIAKLLVAIPEEFKEQTVEIQAFPLPDFKDACPDIKNPRYAIQKKRLGYEVVNAEKIKQGIRITPSRSNAVYGYNNQMLLFSLPKIANTFIAEINVKNLALTNGEKKVGYEPQGPFRSDDGLTCSFRMEASSGDKPIDFTTAKGVLEVKYPSKIITRTVRRGSSDPAIAIDGCQVRVSGSSIVVDKKSIQPSLRAYDTNGDELQIVTNYSSSGFANKVEFEEVRFWGTVESVQVDEPLEWLTVSEPFSTKSAPLLPKQ